MRASNRSDLRLRMNQARCAIPQAVGVGPSRAEKVGAAVRARTQAINRPSKGLCIRAGHTCGERPSFPLPDIASVEVGDFYFVDAADAEDGVRKLLAIVREHIPKRFGLDPVRDILVLCPMNRGGLGARSLNIERQNALNPPGDLRIERFGWTFCRGDKVMQVENDYDKEVYSRKAMAPRTIYAGRFSIARRSFPRLESVGGGKARIKWLAM
jgi:hypothetical protein